MRKSENDRPSVEKERLDLDTYRRGKSREEREVLPFLHSHFTLDEDKRALKNMAETLGISTRFFYKHKVHKHT